LKSISLYVLLTTFYSKLVHDVDFTWRQILVKHEEISDYPFADWPETLAENNAFVIGISFGITA